MDTNFTNKNKFRIVIHNEYGKQLEFFVKAVTFGGISVGITNVATIIKEFKASGSSYSCDDIGIDFYLDEDWNTFIELVKWIKQIRNGENIKSKNMYLNDITIEILDTKYKHNFFIDCKDCFPSAISSISLDEDDDTTTVLCHVEFGCNDYIIDKTR